MTAYGATRRWLIRPEGQESTQLGLSLTAPRRSALGATPALRPLRHIAGRFLTLPGLERRRERPAGGRHVRRAGRA